MHTKREESGDDKAQEEAVSITFLVHHKESRQYDPVFILII